MAGLGRRSLATLALGGLAAAALTPTVRATDRPRRLLVVGDSLAHGVAVLMQAVLAPPGEAARRARVEEIVFTGGGLILRPGDDLLAASESRLAADPPVDALIALVGVNDVGMPLGPGVFYGKDWHRRYVRRMALLVEAATRRGVAVAWVGLPALGRAIFAEPIDRHIRPWQARLADGRADILHIDTLAITSVDGAYSDTLDLGDGPQRLRADDGIHFNADGYRVLARHVLAAMEAAWGWTLLPEPPRL